MTLVCQRLGLKLTLIDSRSASEAIQLGEITQHRGCYAVQGHSRTPMLVPIESAYATSY